MSTVTVVVPTIGRPSLQELLASLAASDGPLPRRVVLVEDRRTGDGPFVEVPERLAGRVMVVPGREAGPAAARNTGWRAADTTWVAFLDDDVTVTSDWL